MTDPVIRIENLGKRYRIGQDRKYKALRDTLSAAAAAPFRAASRIFSGNGHAAAEDPGWFWALKDVSFEVGRGEAIGIIGRNGAGKSTLLKVLSRITDPSEGFVEIEGRVGSLLEVGTGFHPELTGRENIYLNGAILGMKRADITRKFDEIVAFAEVEKFLDTPVKRYSSGMYMRLAFAVAAHLEPEVLVVDEVLAVGDAEFQKKCLGKMSEVAHHGRTVLFVSHNMGAVVGMCSRAIELANGKVKRAGPADDVVRDYMSTSFRHQASDLSSMRVRGYGADVRFRSIDMNGTSGCDVSFNAPLEFELALEADVSYSGLSVASSIFDAFGGCVGTLFSPQTFSIEGGQTRQLQLTIRKPNLAPGQYSCGFSVGRGGMQSGRHDLDIVIGQPAFQVLPVSGNDEVIAHWNSQWGRIVFVENELTVN